MNQAKQYTKKQVKLYYSLQAIPKITKLQNMGYKYYFAGNKIIFDLTTIKSN